MMKSRLFSSESRLSDLITAHPSLLTLLTRLGISLGFGDRSIADVCEESGVDTAFFLLICNVYTFNNYVPSTATILGTDMAGLVPYLEKSHRYYVDKRLPHSWVSQLEGGKPLQAVINGFCGSAEFGNLCKTYGINEFLQTHSDIEGKLDDLLNIVFKYLPPQVDDDNVTDVVYDILRLREDLKKHTFIEEKIMVLLVQHLENAILK